ncbi:Pectinesterase [Drechslerella dactyloides]|uniref:Pectinesterase n=1 Tax=Drechslerella dactyloides TaxID=74499 RepID=A0AAD6J0A6_DREDA|nr:Pectinesterase [Drechslerella dactyloides]
MPIPDAALYPEATGQAAKYFAQHQQEQPLKIYSGWFCPFVQRVLLVLHTKNIPFQYIEVNPYHKPKHLLNLNPRGLVPTLAVPTANGTSKPLFESSVICEYLDEVYSDPVKHGHRLLPDDPYERARARIWIQFVGSNIIPSFHRWLQFQGDDAAKGKEEYFGKEVTLPDLIIAPWITRHWVFDEFKGNNGDWPTTEDDETWARWNNYTKAIEDLQAVKDTSSDREKFFPIYQRYADNTAESEAAKAIRQGSAGLVFAASRTSPPSGAIVVAKSGGQYTGLQAAINSISTSNTGDIVIFIQPGSYSGQVYIPNTIKAKITIYGYTTNDQDFNQNQVTLVNSLGADVAGSNDASGTLRVHTKNFKAYNLNIQNSRGSGVQAIALSTQGDLQGYYGCKLLGYQDTLLANEGINVFDKCYIEGATDFIFGQRAIAWFEKCTIAISGNGYITASGRNSDTNPNYYVINASTVQAKSGVSGVLTYLGRPWRLYARTVFQNTYMTSVVRPAGWSAWGTNPTDNVYYAEYGNTGDGAQGTRCDYHHNDANHDDDIDKHKNYHNVYQDYYNDHQDDDGVRLPTVPLWSVRRFRTSHQI